MADTDGAPAAPAAPAMSTPAPAADTDAAILERAATSILEGVPERFKPLIPTGLSAAQRLEWFAAAKRTGVFDDDMRPAVPATDGNLRPAVTSPKLDIFTLPPAARMARGYLNAKAS